MSTRSVMPLGGSVPDEARRSLVPVGRPARRAIARLSDQTLVSMASVQAEALVARDKIKEIADTADYAMYRLADALDANDALANGNPMKHEDLRQIANLSRLGITIIMQDLVEDLRRI